MNNSKFSDSRIVKLINEADAGVLDVGRQHAGQTAQSGFTQISQIRSHQR